MPRRAFAVMVLVCLLAACGAPWPEPDAPPSPSSVAPPGAAADPGGSEFDPAGAGHIAGQVSWNGPRPVVAPFRSTPTPLVEPPFPPPRDWPNPNAPRIDSRGGLGSAVVFLRGVDPRRSRRWHLPGVRVEVGDDQRFHICQGGAKEGERRNVGFVRLGQAVEIVSRQNLFHSVQGRGACFFARTLPESGSAAHVELDSPGAVELLSGAGYFWMRAYLFVGTHPYYTTTDAGGRFRLEQVPAGEYELVVWHPSWLTAHTDRHPDFFRVQTLTFRPPIETSQRIRVAPGRTTTARLAFPSP